jgi:peptide/nickel transport system substrate-binding protein
MKRLLSLLGVVVFALAVASGAHAKTLRMAYDADPVSLDPHEQLSGGTLQLSHMVFDPLVRWTQELGFEGRLAESWERTNDTTVRFHLRSGVQFHSGNTMTAADVVWTFNRLKESPDFKGIFEPFVEMVAVDDNTVDLITSGPNPLVLHTATYIFPMDSAFYTGTDENGRDKAEIIKHGDSFASSNVSGTGPFVITSREQGVRVDFARFADHWDTESAGNVTEIIFTPIAEAATRVAALLSGDVDFIAPVPPTDLDRISSNDGTELVTMTGTRIITFEMDQDRREELRDPRVRLAIVHAINNAGIVERIMDGFGTAAAQMSPQGYLGYNAALTPRYDLARAQELMAEAGYADGFTLTMMAPNNRYVNDFKIAEAVAAMLAKINITIDLTTMPKAQYWPKFDERAADMMMIGWHSDTEDSANFYEFLSMTRDADTGRGQYNNGGYSNADVDRMTLDSLTMTNDEERAQVLQRIEQIMHDEAAFVPLHWQDLAWAGRSGVHIENIVNVQNFPYLGDLVID